MKDYKRLIEEADILGICLKRGYKVTQKGKNNFIYCPIHEKKYIETDSNHDQNNCFFKDGDKASWCICCQKQMNIIQIVQEMENVSFGKAANFVWEDIGKPSWYKTDIKNITPNESKKRQELNTLGLKLGVMEEFLLPKEQKDIANYKKQQCLNRMEQLEKKFGRNLFEEEKKYLS